MRSGIVPALVASVLLVACQSQPEESMVPTSAEVPAEPVERAEDVGGSDLGPVIVDALVEDGVFGPEQLACTEGFFAEFGVPETSDELLDLILACANAGPLAMGEDIVAQFGALDQGVPLVVASEAERIGQPSGLLNAMQDELFDLTIEAEVGPDPDRLGYFIYSETSRSSGPPLFWDGQAQRQFEVTDCNSTFINYFSTDPREIDLVAVDAIEAAGLIDSVNSGALPVAGTLSLRVLSGEAEASLDDDCRFTQSYSYQYLVKAPEGIPPGEYWVIVDGWATRPWQGDADVPIEVRVESGTFPTLVISMQ